MTSIPARSIRKGDVVSVPATIQGTVTTPQGEFTMTVPADTSVEVTQITLQEDS